jgi:hypothetical protein
MKPLIISLGAGVVGAGIGAGAGIGLPSVLVRFGFWELIAIAAIPALVASLLAWGSVWNRAFAIEHIIKKVPKECVKDCLEKLFPPNNSKPPSRKAKAPPLGKNQE